MGTGILDLASEIIEQITFEAAPKDRKQLRLTCSEISIAAERFVFEHVRLRLTDNAPGETTDVLKALADRSTPLSKHVKTLDFITLYAGPPHSSNTSSWIYSVEDALSSLTQLRVIDWKYRFTGKGNNDIFLAIMRGLSHCQLLDDFSLTSVGSDWDDPPTLPVNCFPSLRKLHMSISGRCVYRNLFRPLAQVFAKSPNLERLSLWIFDSIDGRPSLAPLLEETNIPSLSLNHLELKGWNGVIPRHLARHFQDLKTVIHEFCDSAATSDIWSVLQEEKIQLETVQVDGIEDSFMDYMQSYSGLQSLDAQPFSFPKAMLDHFTSAIIPKHAKSLTKLHLNPSVMSMAMWGLGKVHLETLLSGLPVLEDLSLRIHVRSEYNANDSDTETDFVNMGECLNQIFSSKKLQRVCIIPADLDFESGSYSPQNAVRHRWQSREMVKQAIEGIRVDYATFPSPETFELDTAGPGPGMLISYRTQRDDLLRGKLKFVKSMPEAVEELQHRVVILENMMG